MSFNSHRRNFSLINTQKNTSKIQSRSLRKIIHSNQHNWLLASAKQHYYRQNNMNSAAKQFELYLSHNPNHMQSLYLCAVCYMHIQQHSKAIQKLIQYLTLKKTTRRIIINNTLPPNSNVFLLLSVAYLKVNNLSQALQSANQSLQNDLKFVEGYCLRAKIFTKMQEAKKAYNDYATALKCNSNCLSATMGLGDYYSNTISNSSIALKYYERAKEFIYQQNLSKKNQEQLEKKFLRNSEPQFQELKTIQVQTKNDCTNLEETWKVQDKNDEQLLAELELKCSICYYQLENYNEAIKKLTALLSNQTFQKLSEPFYYLGMSQLRLYKETSFTLLMDKEKSETLFQQAILNIQYSVNMKSNERIMLKAVKALIKLHIENYQFYQAQNILQLAKNNNIEIKEEKQLCETCMEVIKHKYAIAAIKLSKLYQRITKDKRQQCKKIDKKSQMKINTGKPHTTEIQIVPSHKERKGSSYRLKNQKLSTPSTFLKKEQVFETTLPLNYSLNDNKYNLSKSHNKPEQEQSNGQNKQYQISHFLHQDQGNQLEWMKPIILLFRTYAQFFSDNFIECLESFELYENYIKDYLGKQPQNDIYISYNKVLCEAILMMDNDMIEESLQKLTICLDNYYRLARNVPIQPILFKVLVLLKLSQSDHPFLNDQIKGRNKILIHILELFQHYRPILKNNYLAQYYQGLIMLILEDFQQASDMLELCLKNAEECQWKYLYVKGVVQINRQEYKQALKQFSAGLLLQERPELYLGRCVSYIMLYQQLAQKNSVLIQKSFQDLQKFIQLQDDKQKISFWVTKILFFNKAYEQASKSIRKVPSSIMEEQQELIKIDKSLNIFDGNFEDGGVLGRIIMNAFEGTYQKNTIQVSGSRHEIVQSDFIDKEYVKWLQILNLYSINKYPELIKFIQRQIFQAKDSQSDLMELKYNLFVTYLLFGDISKAKNVIASLQKFSEIQERVRKFLDNKIAKDECFQDLQQQFKSTKRLSSFLGYRKVSILIKQQPKQQVEFYIKISIPFPIFQKPIITFGLNQEFIIKQSSQSCIPKKIEAPWIKKITGNIQFTNAIVESMESSVLFENENNQFQNYESGSGSEFSSIKRVKQ